MGNTSQKRALKNYRRRLGKRGMARFEVLGLDADRLLIRSLAKRLAENDADAALASRRRRSRCRSPGHEAPQDRPVTRYLLDTNIIRRRGGSGARST